MGYYSSIDNAVIAGQTQYDRWPHRWLALDRNYSVHQSANRQNGQGHDLLQGIGEDVIGVGDLARRKRRGKIG